MARASGPFVRADGAVVPGERNVATSPVHRLVPQALARPGFELRTGAWVTRIETDRQTGRAVGVRYVDLADGREWRQPADIVVLASYTLGNVHLLLLSQIGEAYDPVSGRGLVGRDYCYKSVARASAFFEDRHFNPWMSDTLTALDDFNAGPDFGRAAAGVAGGYIVYASTAAATPVGARALPAGTPAWGSAWKRAIAHWYPRTLALSAQTTMLPRRGNRLDLDPTYRDALGDPLLRMTFDYGDNERRLSAHSIGTLARIAEAAGATHYVPPQPARHWSAVPYQATHCAGGTRMGRDPGDSVTNGYGQCWQADNLFIAGASLFPHNGCYPPTELVCALAYRTADAIRSRYLARPGPLA
nr:GMC family oxidoreductase [Luteimonas sp. Y-2-2-4F]